ncbi:MAG: hypothetical protein O7B23_04280, partial [Deltaproteobacteria bacterium]|nr:hypothetical protein [Deltaproteobacteria bacterium]
MELIRPGTSIDFMGQTRVCGLISIVLVSVSIGLMFVPGFKLGIDFKGGTVIEVRVPEETGPVDEGRVRQAASAIGFADAVIVRIGPPEDRAFRINVAVSEEESKNLATRVVEGLSKEMGAPVVPQRIESVG